MVEIVYSFSRIDHFPLGSRADGRQGPVVSGGATGKPQS